MLLFSCISTIMSNLKFALLLVSLVTCLSPWIFAVWWWPCNLYVSISSTCTAVACFVFIITLILRQSPDYIKAVLPFIILLFSSPGIYGLINGGTCHSVPFYTTIIYISPINLICLIYLFVATTIIAHALSYKPTNEERQVWKNFKLLVFIVMTCVFATWIPVLWVFTCDTLPHLPISSTFFSVFLWLITLGRLLKDHKDLSLKWRYIIFVIEYLIMSCIFGVCIYLNLSLLGNTTCCNVIVTYSLIIYIFFGILFSALTFWYFLYICVFSLTYLPRCSTKKKRQQRTESSESSSAAVN